MPELPALHPAPDRTAAGSAPADETAPTDRLAFLSAAAEALTAGSADEALLLLASAEPLGPADATTHFLAGVAWLQIGEPMVARAELEAAVELDPTDTATRCVLARACEAQGDLDAAVVQLQAAVTLDAGQARLHTFLGHLYLERDDIVPAYESFMQAVQLDPADEDAHRGIALLFLRAGEPDRAEQAFRQALRLLPDDPLLHAGLGNALRELERDDEALDSYLRARDLNPDHAMYQANVASTLFGLGRLQEARGAYERALSLRMERDARRALVHCNYATVLELLGDEQGAAEEYEAALDVDPACAMAHESLGMLCLDRGRDGEAVFHLAQALDLQGLGAEAAVRLTLLHEARGEADEARRCAALLADADNGSIEVAFRRAQLMVQSNDPEIRDTSEAILIVRMLLGDGQAGDAALWNLLGEALAREGSYEEAVQAAERALQSAEPGDPAWQLYTNRRALYLSRVVDR